MADLNMNRLSALRAGMRENGVDVLIVGPTSNMIHLIGKKLPSTERFNALIVPLDGTPRLILPTLQYALASDIGGLDVVKWDETADPIEILAKLLDEMGAKSVAVDGLIRSAFLLRLQARAGSIAFSEAEAITSRARLCKDADEIAALSDAGKRFDAIWQEFWEKGRLLGVTERDVVEQIRKLLFAHGFETMDWCDVGSGPNGASPLHHHSDRVIQPGDPVVIDFAGTIGGYFMDTCRTPVAGEPDAAFVEIYNIVAKAHDAANAAARPGVAAQDVDRAAREVIGAAGYGQNFLHRLGHGLGLDPHEQPYIVAGNTLELQPGMVFSNEPGIYIDGKWGVRIENIMLMTKDGVTSFNEAPRHLVTMN